MYFQMVKHPFKLLKQRSLFSEFYIANLQKVVAAKLGRPNSGIRQAMRKGQAMNCEFLSNAQANSEIARHICDDEPFFLCRYGATELSLCVRQELIRLGAAEGFGQEDLDKGKRNSGIFPKSVEVMHTFTETYTAAMKQADMNAYWGSLVLEEYMGKQLFRDHCKQHTMRALEPFPYEQPWTAALAGKKVLIVHPFADLIRYQYTKREQLFENKMILPDFRLSTVQAIQSSGDTEPVEYETWMTALAALTEACLACDFDVALLSCGSYAVPLGARLKAAGKKAIVLGGMLQLMFGIKGTRWEQSRPDIVALYNDAWVRAGDQFKIKGTEKMADGAAYW